MSLWHSLIVRRSSARSWPLRRHAQGPRRSRAHRLQLEVLEDRTLLSTFLVDRLTDTGDGSGLVGDLRLHAPTRQVRAHLDLRPIPMGEEPVAEPERSLELLGQAVVLRQAAFSSGSSASASATGGLSPSIGLTRSRSRPSASYTLAWISSATSGCSSRWALALARPWPMRSSP